jgi:hypothetical protein
VFASSGNGRSATRCRAPAARARHARLARRLGRTRVEAQGGTAEAFAAFLTDERATRRRAVAASGATVD